MPKTTSREDKTTKTGSNATSAKHYRPGQRQQERMLRAARRRRRRMIWIGTIATIAIIILATVGVLEYQRYTAAQAAQAKQEAEVHATATARVEATQTAVNATPTPTAGPATPPPVDATPIALPNGNGVQYIDITQGSGATVQKGDTISVEYTGWLAATGKKFDSSYDHGGQPLQFTVGQGQMIPGFDAGVIGMKVGGTRRLFIPAAQGYGAAGNPPAVPANANLIFDVTVVSIQGK